MTEENTGSASAVTVGEHCEAVAGVISQLRALVTTLRHVRFTAKTENPPMPLAKYKDPIRYAWEELHKGKELPPELQVWRPGGKLKS